jgi:hypothetical protein
MENYKILCITRHSLRGPLGFFNSQEIDLPNDIKFPNPFLTWNQNLEKDANKLIHIEQINQCVELGLQSIGISYFNKNWNEIRCDFLAQRCFETGRILKEKIGNNKLKLTAVINKKEPNELFTYSNTNIDAVTYNIAPSAFPFMPPSTPTSLNPEIFYLLTANLLNYLNLALKNKNFTGKLPPEIINGEVTFFYKNNINITNDLITMSALTIPPLHRRRFKMG